jgi:kumamolisin
MTQVFRNVSIAMLLSAGLVRSDTPAAAEGRRRITGVVPREVGTGLARFQYRMDPQQMLRLTLVLRPPRQEELQRLVDEVNDRNSPRFHQFLTFDEWKARFAPSDAEVDTMFTWARSQGLTVIHRFRNNLALKVEGSTADIEKAFDVHLIHYTLGRRQFFSADRDPSVAAPVSDLLQNVHGLENLRRVRVGNRGLDTADDDEPIYRAVPFRGESRAFTPGQITSERVPLGPDVIEPLICCGSGGLLEPPDLWSSQAYNLAPLQQLSKCCNPTNSPQGPPKETSIAIIGTNYANPNDINVFFARYGLTNLVVIVPINGPQCCDLEVTVDIDSAAAFSKSSTTPANAATIYNYQGGGTLITDNLDAWHMALSDDSARIASSSFGAPEDKFCGFEQPCISDFTDVINAMSAIGWTIVAAAGDHGAYDNCQNLSVDFPASSPAVLAIGGTTLTLGNSGLFLTEVSWTGNGCGGSNWPGSNNGGGGGGCSVDTFVAPSWQRVTATGCGNSRAVPDIALNAGMPNGVGGISNQVFFYGGNWISAVGTSIAAPEVAGFLAQTASYLKSLGTVCGPQHNSPCVPFGNPAPAIWIQGSTGPQGGAVADHNPFYDIINGCSGGSGDPLFFMCAGTGYDRATGWGSANMLQLAWTLISWSVNNGTNGRAPAPQITWQFNPAINGWYNTDQLVSWQVTSPNYPGTTSSVGVAGFTAQWDAVVIDSISKPVPGTGDGFYSGPKTLASSGSLSLKAAGLGCHTAHVRGWDNTGQVTFDETYGPLCYDNIPPTFTCGAADGLWHATDVAIACTASDQPGLSGLANPADAAFALSTNFRLGRKRPMPRQVRGR